MYREHVFRAFADTCAYETLMRGKNAHACTPPKAVEWKVQMSIIRGPMSVINGEAARSARKAILTDEDVSTKAQSLFQNHEPTHELHKWLQSDDIPELVALYAAATAHRCYQAASACDASVDMGVNSADLIACQHYPGLRRPESLSVAVLPARMSWEQPPMVS
jgi:hypothetical protein